MLSFFIWVLNDVRVACSVLVGNGTRSNTQERVHVWHASVISTKRNPLCSVPSISSILATKDKCWGAIRLCGNNYVLAQNTARPITRSCSLTPHLSAAEPEGSRRGLAGASGSPTALIQWKRKGMG